MSSFLKNPTVQVVANYFPNLTTTALAVACFAIGMIWAYGIQPVQYVNGDPSQLEQSFQDQWVIGAAGRMGARNADISGTVRALLQEVDNPQEIVSRLQNAPEYAAENAILINPEFQQLVVEAQQAAAPPPPQPGIFNNYIAPLIVLIVFAILFIIGNVLWTLLIFPFFEPYLTGSNKAEDSKIVDAIKDSNARMAEMMKTEVKQNIYGDPVIRKLSLFKDGYGNYDDSFNIETPEKLYYGEAGATISESNENGVTAIEVWMFDKNEFANTPTVIFATEAAMNDPAVMANLQNKGDVIKLEPGAKKVLETNALYVEAIAHDVDYKADAPDALNESSIEIIAWSKAGVPGGGSSTSGDTVPAPLPNMPQMPASPPPPAPTADSSPLAPPPLNMDALAGFAPPAPSSGSPSGQTPLAPPPMGGSNPPPEDPFEGAGDFTPVNPNK